MYYVVIEGPNKYLILDKYTYPYIFGACYECEDKHGWNEQHKDKQNKNGNHTQCSVTRVLKTLHSAIQEPVLTRRNNNIPYRCTNIDTQYTVIIPWLDVLSQYTNLCIYIYTQREINIDMCTYTL